MKRPTITKSGSVTVTDDQITINNFEWDCNGIEPPYPFADMMKFMAVKWAMKRLNSVLVKSLLVKRGRRKKK